MKLANYLAGSKRFALIFLARTSLRIASRLLHVAFKGFRAGYLPLGVLRAASGTAGRLQRFSLLCWGTSTGRPRPSVRKAEDRKPLPQCLTQLLQAQVSDRARSRGRHSRIPTRSEMRLRRF